MKKLIVVFILVLIIGGYFIKANYNLDLDNNSDKKTFVKVFTSWLGRLFTNFKDITAYTIKKDWSTPEPNNTTEND